MDQINETNETNRINQINETNQINQNRVDAEGKMSNFKIQMTNDWVRHTDTSTKHEIQ
jgi:hypothetical protein